MKSLIKEVVKGNTQKMYHEVGKHHQKVSPTAIISHPFSIEGNENADDASEFIDNTAEVEFVSQHDGSNNGEVVITASRICSDGWSLKISLVAAFILGVIVGATIMQKQRSSLYDHQRQPIVHPSHDPPSPINHKSSSKWTSSCSWTPTLLWSDEFEGSTLDMTKWSYQNGNGCDVGLCGWGNNELETYSPENLRVENGKLIMEARHQDGRYTSSKIISKNKADFGPVGRFEARMVLPRGQGIWPAFWMLPTDNVYGGWPKSGEIDIMENIGKESPNTIHGTIHYGQDWPNNQHSEAGINLNSTLHGDFSRTFHTFAVERQPNLIRWFVNNIAYSTKTPEDTFPNNWPFDEYFYFILNVAIGGNWPGNPDASTVFPQKMVVDYVRVYNGTFSRIEGPYTVNAFETDAVYTIEDDCNVLSLKDEIISDKTPFLFKWTVPDDAIIENGQGTRKIVVKFGEKSGTINVEETTDLGDDNTGNENINDTNDTSRNKPSFQKMGLHVNVLKPISLDIFNFDCGQPSKCTQEVLNRDAEGYTCGQRIQWLMETQKQTEKESCEKVGHDEFNGICGSCNPN